MNRLRSVLISAVAAAVSVLGAATASAIAPEPLPVGDFALISGPGAARDAGRAGIGTSISISETGFSGHSMRITGNTGCNDFSVHGTATGEVTFKLAEVAMTRRACLDDTVASIEAQLVADLSGQHVSLTRDASGVVLTSGAHVWHFHGTVVAPVAPAAVQGSWRVNHMYTSSPLLGAVDYGITLHISADGSVNGKAVCNSYVGPATFDNNRVSLTRVTTTQMVCEPGHQAEDVFFTILGNSSWNILDGRLVLEHKGSYLVFDRA